MTVTYADIVHGMANARSDGHSVDTLVLTQDSMDTFLTDGEFTESDEEVHDNLGEFELRVTVGDDNYLITERDKRIYFN